MNRSETTPEQTRLSYAGAILGGIGGGLVLATVLYRYFPSADLTDPLRLIGFALLVVGGVLRQRARKNREPGRS